MSALALLAGVAFAPLAAAVVYADATRRALPARRRAAWALFVGVGGLVGFAVPAVFGSALARLYLRAAGSPLVVTAPYELLALRLAVGGVLAAVPLAAYGLVVEVTRRRRNRERTGRA